MLNHIQKLRIHYNNGGPVRVLITLKGYISNKFERQKLKYKYRWRYGDIAPEPDERINVDPQEIDYTIWSNLLYNEGQEYPRYGILSGEWDLRKTYWRDVAWCEGLRERFVEKKEWEETQYYEEAIRKLESNESFGPLDGEQTMENFKDNLDYLDRLYADIKHNGYDPSSVITVHIGRDGELMVGHGNHRCIIAEILGIESIPVRIKYRHEKWQKIRQIFHESSSVDQLGKNKKYLDHPDIPELEIG